MTDAHFDTSKAARLDNESRIKELRIPELLRDVLKIKGGTVAVDLGAGTGAFALRLAPLMGTKGRVCAVDDSADMLNILRSRNPPPNLFTIKANFTSTGLDSGIADFCLATFIVHETNEKQALINEAYRLLKPGGRLLVLEWQAEGDFSGPRKEIRVSPQTVETLFRSAGFTEITSQNWTEKHYFVLGNKS